MSHPLPILYSFRRCPYAIRARLAIAYSGVQVQIVEVDLKNKPADMLRLSPKGTVPVLQLFNGHVLEQSIDIMHWALSISDPDGWLLMTADEQTFTQALLLTNDGPFKVLLDRYKYSIRFPEHDPQRLRVEALDLLEPIVKALRSHPYIIGPSMRWIDAALFPFVRQFAGVDEAWFRSNADAALLRWFDSIADSTLFQRVMSKSNET